MAGEAILNKLRRYCAYQERCHEEVRSKLLSLHVYGNELEEVINQLIEEDFLNEERFAMAYAGGKFRMKQWGRLKILKELKKRKVSEYCIKKAMREIEDAEYMKTIGKLIRTARSKYKKFNAFEANSRIATYLIGKGYEPELVWEQLKKEKS
jgi:regulatory protein